MAYLYDHIQSLQAQYIAPLRDYILSVQAHSMAHLHDHILLHIFNPNL
jgi:hypothetical protein